MTKEKKLEVLESGRYCRDAKYNCDKCIYYGKTTRDITCLGMLMSALVDALADEMDEKKDEQHD